MKSKKKRIVGSFLFIVGFCLLCAFIKMESYQASVYTKAMEFFYATGTVDDKHIDIVDGTIYFGTRAKLAHTYAAGFKYYYTLGYDVTMSGGGKSLTFSVKRGGSLTEVPNSLEVDSYGYEYLLYSIPTQTIIDLAERADPENAAVVLASSKIDVVLNAIVTVRQNGKMGDIVEDGKGGLIEYEENGAIYHFINEDELEACRRVFNGTRFYTYIDITAPLENYKLTLYYNVGPATIGNRIYYKDTYDGAENMLFQNNSIYNKEKYRLLQEFKLMDTGVNGLNLNYRGYHLDINEEWIKKDGTPLSVSNTYTPKIVETSVGFEDKALVLYANWKPNTYDVEYHANGGEGTMAATTETYDNTFELSQNVFTREGYTFKGWATSSDGEVAYQDMESVSNMTTVHKDTVKLYAVWQENVSVVTLDSTTPMNKAPKNKGSETYYQKYEVGNFKEKDCSTKITSITKPSESGYIFCGYYTGKDGAGKQYVDKDGTILSTSTTFDSDITLYAYWTPIAYTIQYDANGGTGTMADTAATYDKDVVLRPNTFSNTGNKFMGWATSKTGDVIYEDKEQVENLTTENEKVLTLYAVWKPNIYKIELDNQGATSAGTPVYYEKYGKGNYTSSACDVAINNISKPSRTGYTFKGYYTSREGQGTQIIDSSGKITAGNKTFTDDEILYAYWRPNKYTIKYHANGGSGTMKDTSASYDADVTLRSCMFSNTGKTFKGWAASATGAVVYNNRDEVSNLTVTDGGTVTLYAVWQENIYTITLNSDGADTDGTSVYYEKYSKGNYTTSACTTIMSTITKPQKTGYIFKGYYTSRGGIGTSYINASGTITAGNTTFTDDKTLYAYWSPSKYTIRYNANGGSGAMADTSAVYEESVSLKNCTYTKTGYTFKGWAQTSDGAVVYKDKDSVKNLNTKDGEIITLYAVWEPLRISVSLNHQGGQSTTNAFYVIYGKSFYSNSLFTSTITQVAKPTLTGYTFKGYFADSMGSGNAMVNESGTITAGNTTFLKDTTIFAKWIPKTFTLTFDKQGGSYGSDSVTATYKQPLPPAEAPQNPGYTFKGYYTGTGGSGTKYYDEYMNTDIVYTQEKNMTLYAYWVDDFAPEITLNVSTDSWTSRQVTLTAYAKDHGSGLSSVQIYEIALDNSLKSVASATGLNGAKTKELAFINTKEGVVRYKAVATDMKGNTSESYNTVYYDKTAPVGTVDFTIDGNKITIELDVTDANTGS